MWRSGGKNKQVYHITAFDEGDKGDSNGTLFLLGLFCIVVCLISLNTSLEERTKYDRWQNAPQLCELGELRVIGLGNEVTLSGSISLEMPASNEGLALYETWERKTSSGRYGKREKWKRVDTSNPDLELLFGPYTVVIQSEDAVFQRAKEVQLDSDTRLKGFAPGDEVFVMGAVASIADARVQADVLCGGDREQCLGQMSQEATKALLQAAIAALVGVGLIAFGIVRKKFQ